MQFIKKKEERDNIYKELRELKDRKNEIAVKLQEDKIKKQVEAIKKREELMKMKAEEIYEEFKKGKKLNTEEFRILQEGGLL
jgi:phosphoserine phosphatase